MRPKVDSSVVPTLSKTDFHTVPADYSYGVSGLRENTVTRSSVARS